eukprot:4752140-Amphidinium_carterae.1
MRCLVIAFACRLAARGRIVFFGSISAAPAVVSISWRGPLFHLSKTSVSTIEWLLHGETA